MASTNNGVIDYSENRNIQSAKQNWSSALVFAEQSNTYRLINALTSTYNAIDDDLEDIYTQTHVNSATGRELDQFGELVNVERKYNEGDDKYSTRIKAAFRASTIGTTYNQFVQFCGTIFNTDVDNISFVTDYINNPATITVGVESFIFDGTGFTKSEIIDILGSGVPAGHEVDVVEGGSFRLKSDGEDDDPSEGLTSDTTDTGGTVFEELS